MRRFTSSLRRRTASDGADIAHAEDHLRYIRRTMEQAGSFTAVSGWGQVAVGVIGMTGAAVAVRTSTPVEAVAVWIVAASLAVPVAMVAIVRKCRRLGMPVLSGPARRFVLCLTPSFIAAAFLTVVLIQRAMLEMLPGLWLLLYGTGVVAGGVLSIRLVPIMGGCFMVLGAAAFIAPPGWHIAFMAAGFGVLHVAFGLVIAVRHGG